ncbi:MAG: insulinase family protein, partial [Pseudomonadota bacterium]|nr:insulinase family protein [Pseudomonadota bacterium]
KEHLPVVMHYEADRMGNLVLTDDTVRPELQVVLEERRMRIDNDPSARLGEVVQATLYQHHPYRIPVIGWRPEIEGLKREDAITFYDRFYTPNNAILVVAGDVTAEVVRRLADATYGKVARRAAPGARQRPVEPEPIAERSVRMRDPRVQQPTLRRYYSMPSYRTAKPGEAEAIDILAELLGGGSTSRLYRELVIEKQVASSVSSWYQGTSYDYSTLGIYVVPRPGVTLEALGRALDEALQRVVETPPEAAEIERVKNRLIADLIHSQDSQSTLARIYGTALATGSTVEDISEWPRRVMAVPADQVMSVAQAYVRPERAVTGYLERTTDAQAAQGRS